MRALDFQKGLTVGRLRELLGYDPDTGVFVWKKLPHTSASNINIGDIAGSTNGRGGYIRIWIDGRRYLAHRLAWFYVRGEWPEQLDHEDCDGANIRIANLRLATDLQNATNKRVRADNMLGIKGVRLHENGRYQARIYHNKKFKSLGCYTTPEEAAAAYKAAAEKLFGEFARL